MRRQKGNQKLQIHFADISDVEVVRVLFYSSSRKKKKNLRDGRNCTWEELTE